MILVGSAVCHDATSILSTMKYLLVYSFLLVGFVFDFSPRISYFKTIPEMLIRNNC